MSDQILDKYDFACIDSESEECRRDIEAHSESKKWGETLECGGVNHPNRRRVLLTQRLSPFVDGNGHPLDQDTTISVFKALEYRRGRYGYFCFMAAMTAILLLSTAILLLSAAAVCVDVYANYINGYVRLHSSDIYFPEKTISDCKFKRILYFSGKSREYVCPDGSLVVVGKDVRNKDCE